MENVPNHVGAVARVLELLRDASHVPGNPLKTRNGVLWVVVREVVVEHSYVNGQPASLDCRAARSAELVGVYEEKGESQREDG